MDILDRQIIAKLEADGTLTNAAMARDIGKSEETVRRRIKSLVASGAMRIAAIPNMEMLGYSTKALVGITVDPPLMKKAAEVLSTFPSVEWVMVTLGAFDIVIQLVVKDTEELYRVIREDVGTIMGVKALNTLVVAESAKTGFHTNGKNPA